MFLMIFIEALLICKVVLVSSVQQSDSVIYTHTQMPGASVRNSAHGKGHEEGGLAYTKA